MVLLVLEVLAVVVVELRVELGYQELLIPEVAVVLAVIMELAAQADQA